MPNYKLGIALFTTENITAILRSIPDSNDTYADIARQARGHGAIVSPRTISRWVNVGRADILARRNNTAYARFAKRYDGLLRRTLRAGRHPKRRIHPGTGTHGKNMRVRQRQDADAERRAERHLPGLPRDR